MTAVSELRPLTAGALLEIQRKSADAAWSAEERALRRNAEVLARCCFWEGERVFDDAKAVLEQLTVGEMERLLSSLLWGGGPLAATGAVANASFDAARFIALREEGGWTT